MYTFSWSFVVTLLLGLSSSLAVVALPATGAGISQAECKEIEVRKEWRDLTVEQRLDYIRAVKCLMTTPPREPGKRAASRFEEFQDTHILLTDRIHSVGHFLPWHRYQATLYGRALRDECGYKGPTAFWDWARDGDTNKPMLESPIFDPVTGFGGDGVRGTYTLPPDPNGLSAVPDPRTWVGCVQDGPFREGLYTVRLGPGKLVTNHCLVRGTNEAGWKRHMTSANVNAQLASRTFEEFRLVIDNFFNGIHGLGHAFVGGEMTNVYSAGADPLFYLHHTNLDRHWWLWQKADPENRTYAISGPTTQNGTEKVTLDFMMDFPALAPNVTVRDVMDTTKAHGCFVYDY